jgi:hypothetical protein
VKSLLLLLVLLLAGLAAWLMREPGSLARLTERAKQSVAPALTSATSATSATPSTSSQSASPAGLRKCKRGSEVLYTNDKCPAGSQEDLVKGGSLSVLPAAPVVAAPVTDAASEPSMKDKRMDKIIGQ